MKIEENALKKIIELKNDLDIDLIEAALLFCEKQDIDPEELVQEILDSNGINMLKQDAIENHKVKRTLNKQKKHLVFDV